MKGLVAIAVVGGIAAAVHAGISPEIPVGSIDLRPATIEFPTLIDRYSLAIASQGGAAFAIWKDSRVSIMGTRINSEGVLDPLGVPLFELCGPYGATPCDVDAIAWNGSNYVVLTKIYDNEPFPREPRTANFRASLVNSSGRVMSTTREIGRFNDVSITAVGGRVLFVALTSKATIVSYTYLSDDLSFAEPLRELALPPVSGLDYASAVVAGNEV